MKKNVKVTKKVTEKVTEKVNATTVASANNNNSNNSVIVTKTSVESIIYVTSQQFDNFPFASTKGVTLYYERNVRDKQDNPTTSVSALIFSGGAFAPNDVEKNSLFAAWKNILITYWGVKSLEVILRAQNSGITSKLRGGVPSYIVFRAKDGKRVRFNISESVWKNIGLIPRADDLKKLSARDFKKSLHKAAMSSFEAITFAFSFKSLEADVKRIDNYLKNCDKKTNVLQAKKDSAEPLTAIVDACPEQVAAEIKAATNVG